LQKAIARFQTRSLCKIKSNITTKPLDDWKYFTKESAGHQRRLLIKVISESFLAVVVLMGNLCWLWLSASGHLGWYQLKI
jgi:ABC-type tungstate transport system substrate-binding protein